MKLVLRLASVGLIIAVCAVFWIRRSHGPELPVLQFEDVGMQKNAGRVSKANGSTLKVGQSVPLGTEFKLAEQSSVQIVTEGNWIVEMDGQGEFSFENALTNADRTIHTAYWFVRKGELKIRPKEYDPAEHYMQIRTPIARVFLHRGEAGMKVTEGGGGQIWIYSGTATIVWDDGRRKEIHSRGMEYI